MALFAILALLTAVSAPAQNAAVAPAAAPQQVITTDAAPAPVHVAAPVQTAAPPPIRSNSHIITHAADVRFLSKNISGLTGYRSTGATFRRSAGSTAADSNPMFTPQVTESTDAEIPASVFFNVGTTLSLSSRP